MGLSVIGAGFGRTGTMSLKLALEQIGFGPCHHMEEVFENPSQVPKWVAAISGEAVDWDDIYDGYNATADWPGAHFTHELAAHFPDAKIVLTMRDVDRWWESFSSTIMMFLKNFPDDAPPHIDAMARAVMDNLLPNSFGTAFDDEAAAKAAYLAHVEKVTTSYPAERVLQFNLSDGWAPLCDFLNKPVPDTDFPRANDRVEFFENFSPEGRG